MIEPVSVTLDEASYVTQHSISFVNEVLNQYFVKRRVKRGKSGWIRKVGLAELRFVRISQEIRKNLTEEAYCRVYAGLRKIPADSHCLVAGIMCFDLAQADQVISARLDRLQTIRRLTDVLESGSVNFEGTNTSIMEISKLSRSKDLEYIQKLYPMLTADNIDMAIDLMKVYPDIVLRILER